MDTLLARPHRAGLEQVGVQRHREVAAVFYVHERDSVVEGLEEFAGLWDGIRII